MTDNNTYTLECDLVIRVQPTYDGVGRSVGHTIEHREDNVAAGDLAGRLDLFLDAATEQLASLPGGGLLPVAPE